MTSQSGTSTLPKRKHSARGSRESVADPARSHRTGSSDYRLRHSGNTLAVPTQRQRHRSATASVVRRRTSKGSRTTARSPDRRSIGPRESVVILRMPGDYMTCTATVTSGVGTGFTQGFLEARIQIFMRSGAPRIRMAHFLACVVAGVGLTMDGPVAQPFAYGSLLNSVTTT